MLKKILFPALIVGLLFAVSSPVNAQQKSFERKTKKHVENKETMDMGKCTQMDKCIDKIAADSEMRNEMILKLNGEFEEASTVPIEKEDIQGKPLQLNKPKIERDKQENQKSQVFTKLPYKKK